MQCSAAMRQGDRTRQSGGSGSRHQSRRTTGRRYPLERARQAGARAAAHLHRDGDSDRGRRRARGGADAGRYLPRYPRARDRHRLAVSGPVARRYERPDHHPAGTHADDDGQRHRPYRKPVDAGHRHREDLLPARRRHPHRHRAGHVRLADRPEADAPRHHPAADPQLQRLDRADPSARAVGEGIVGGQDVRPGAEPDPPRSGHRARRGDPLSVGRAPAADPDRSRPAGAAVQGAVRAGRRQRHRRAEPDQPRGVREDRRVPVQCPPEQRARIDRRSEQPAGQGRERRDDLHARRRARPRRHRAADQRRPCRRIAVGADDDPEERVHLHAGDRAGDQGRAA